MKITHRAALLTALSLGVAQPAFAQAIPATKIATVDLDRISRECTACKAAQTALQQQAQTFETRRQQLAKQLQPEDQYLQTAVNALAGKQPDATLAARIKAYQQNQTNAAQELQGQQAQFQRNQQYVQFQLMQKLQTLYSPVMLKHSANVLVEVNTTLATATGMDITGDLLAALNAALPSLVTTAPPPPQTVPAAGATAPRPATPQPEGR